MKEGPELLVNLEKLNVHKCEKCPKVFPNLTDLSKHKSYHEERFLSHVVSVYVPVERAKIFKCDRCTQSFGTNRDLMLHKLAHIQENVRIERKIKRLQTQDDIMKPYKCPDCDVKFVAESSLEEHSILHLPFPNICECGIGYYKQHDLKCHIKLVHGTEKALSQNIVRQEKKTIHERKPNKGSKSKAILTKKKNPIKNKWKVKLKAEDTNSNDNIPKYYTVPNPDIDVRKTSDNKFECPECKKSFNCKKYVYIHYRTHTGERPYSCNSCEKSFSQYVALLKHIERVHTTKERIYVCKHCPKAFTCPGYRARHEDTHSAIKAHECPYCGKAFHDQSAMIRHRRIHTGDKRYQCPYCPKAFSDVSGLAGHKLRHENRKNFECEICSKKFYDKHILKNHMVAVHSEERNFTCDYCEKDFSCKSYLMVHIKRHMFTKKKFECEHCHKKFLIKTNLKKHIVQVHKRTKLVHKKLNKKLKRFHECTDCSKKFTKKYNLQKHYASTHSGIHCVKCSRYFASKMHLDRHMLKKSVKCEICEERFFCKNMKGKHLKVHLDELEKQATSNSDRLREN